MAGQRILVAMVAFALLGGCALLDAGSEPAPQIYVLTPAKLDGGAVPLATSGAPRIAVEPMTAPATLARDRIAYRPTANEVAYYAGARWGDTLPAMLQSVLVETLADSYPDAVVAPGRAGFTPNYRVSGEITEFSAAPGPDGRAEVSIAYTLRVAEADTLRVIGQRRFATPEPVAASGTSMADIVTAFDGALTTLLRESAVWVGAYARTARTTG